MKLKLDDFLRMSAANRRKVRVRRTRRGPYMQRPKRTPEELLAYLKTNHIKSVRQLQKNRKPDEPNLYDITKAHGSFSAAKEQAFGKPLPFDLPLRPDPTYLINTVSEFSLFTRDHYQAARRKSPAIVPSLYWVRLLFGSWDKLRWASEQVDLKACINRWLALRRHLGRSPSMVEVENAGMSLEPVKTLYPTRGELNAFLHDLARHADKLESANQNNLSDIQQAI